MNLFNKVENPVNIKTSIPVEGEAVVAVVVAVVVDGVVVGVVAGFATIGHNVL